MTDLGHEVMISIHALREEGDSSLWSAGRMRKHFNPRPPRGGRQVMYESGAITKEFQSTPSARRAT